MPFTSEPGPRRVARGGGERSGAPARTPIRRDLDALAAYVFTTACILRRPITGAEARALHQAFTPSPAVVGPAKTRRVLLVGLAVPALLGAALGVPAGDAPGRPSVVRITCPAAERSPLTLDTLPASARCSWRYRIGVRHPTWP